MLAGGLNFVISKTSSVSSKTNTADSGAERKKGNKEQIQSSTAQENLKEWNTGAWVRGPLPSGDFPRCLESFTNVDSKANGSSPTEVICNFADKGTCCCVLSTLLCWTPRSFVAFALEVGLVVSLDSISHEDDSVILSGTMVSVLQLQSCNNSRWLLCGGRGVF